VAERRRLGEWLLNPPVLLALLWGAVWALGGLFAPLYAAARDEMGIAVAASLVFATGFAAALRWPVFPAKEEDALPSSLLVYAGALAFVLGIGALFGLYQVYGPAGLPRTFATMEQNILATMPEGDAMRAGLLHAMREGRAAGTIGAPNLFASFCAAGAALAAGLAFALKHPAARYGFGALAVVSAWAVIASGSNGGVLALFVALLTLAAGLIGCRLTQKQLRWLVAGVAIIAAVVLAGAVLAALATGGTGERWLGSSGIQQRLYYWQAALGIWQENPLFGQGPGSFEILYPQFRVPGAGETREPHSWLFNHLAETGLLGLGLFAALIASVKITMLKALGRLHREGRWTEYTIYLAMAAAAAALVVHGLAEYTLCFNEGLLLFVLLLAALAGLGQQIAPMRLPGWTRRRSASGLAAIPLALAAAGSLGVYHFWFVPAMGELSREEAEALIMDRRPSEEIIAAYSRAIDADPANPALWEARGVFRLRANDQAGMADLERAREIHPQSARLHESLAQAHARRDQWDEALRLQRHAVERHPLDVSHRLTLAEFLLETGSRQEALEMARSTKGLLTTTDAEEERRAAMLRRLEDKID